jgi:hypothetical protein
MTFLATLAHLRCLAIPAQELTAKPSNARKALTANKSANPLLRTTNAATALVPTALPALVPSALVLPRTSSATLAKKKLAAPLALVLTALPFTAMPHNSKIPQPVPPATDPLASRALVFTALLAQKVTKAAEYAMPKRRAAQLALERIAHP